MSDDFVPGIAASTVQVDALFLAAALDVGPIFGAVIRMAKAALKADDVTLTRTEVQCLAEPELHQHLESECTDPSSARWFFYTYQPTAELTTSVAGDTVVAPAMPPRDENLVLPDHLVNTPDPRFPAKAKGKGKKP